MTQPDSDRDTAVAAEEVSVRRLLGAGLAARILLDTGVQMFFPFLPIFAQGLGTTAVAMGRLVSLRSITGLLAPLSSPLTARFGYRFVLRLGLVVAALGYFLIGVSGNLWLAAVGMVLAGLGTFSFVPTLQAYLSTYLPYNRRARGLGIIEMGWSLAGIFGLFLVGEIIARTNWRVPLFVVGGALLLAALYYRTLPAAGAGRKARAAVGQGVGASVRAFMMLGANRRSAWSALLVFGLVLFAGMHLFISYGTWLVDAFGLGPAQLGRVALITGVGDLSGVLLVTLLSDRLGKRRSALLATAASALFFLLLPALGTMIVTAVGVLFFARMSFEASVVSIIPLLSEQVPAQRSKILALGTSSGLVGSAISGLTGPWAYARFGVWGLALGAAVGIAVACLLLWTQVRE